MKCPYTFTETDKPVQDGKRQVGEICNDFRGSEEYNGLCMAHALSTGVVPQDKVDAAAAKRADTIKKTRDRVPEDIAAAKSGADGDSKYNKNVMEAMNLNDPCDLNTEYAVFKNLNQNPGYESYAEKMAFARWLRTPLHLRNPQTIEGASEVLGVSKQTLFVWKSAPDVVRFINMDTENRALAMFPFAMYKLGCGIDRGDASSIKLYKEWYEEKSASQNKKERTLDLPDELQKEANEYADATGKQNRGRSLTSEKNMVVDSHFAGSGLAPDNEQ